MVGLISDICRRSVENAETCRDHLGLIDQSSLVAELYYLVYPVLIPHHGRLASYPSAHSPYVSTVVSETLFFGILTDRLRTAPLVRVTIPSVIRKLSPSPS